MSSQKNLKIIELCNHDTLKANFTFFFIGFYFMFKFWKGVTIKDYFIDFKIK
jgi:hypothetical protein